jgi:hypothetical protein
MRAAGAVLAWPGPSPVDQALLRPEQRVQALGGRQACEQHRALAAIRHTPLTIYCTQLASCSNPMCSSAVSIPDSTLKRLARRTLRAHDMHGGPAPILARDWAHHAAAVAPYAGRHRQSLPIAHLIDAVCQADPHLHSTMPLGTKYYVASLVLCHKCFRTLLKGQQGRGDQPIST